MEKENYQADSLELENNGDITLTDETSSAVDDDWYDDDLTERPEPEPAEEEKASGAEADGADQPTEGSTDDSKEAQPETDEAEATVEGEQETEQKEGEADQLFTLKHLDETHEVNREQVIALAQKGLDYDRKTEKLNGKIAELEGFLNEIAAPSGLPYEQFMDSVRAKMLIASEKEKGNELSETAALLRVQTDRAQKAQQAAQEAAQEAERRKTEAKKRTDDAISSFARERPDVKSSDIPQSVWDEFHRTGDLLGAYARHENGVLKKANTELEKRIEALENNAKAAQASTKSSKSAGTPSANEEFDALWYDGT